jgi:glyoxylate/hydroxypyruvate reductase A
VRVLVYTPSGIDEWARAVRAPRGVTVLAAGNPEDAVRLAPDVEVIYGWKVPPEVLVRARQLRWVQVMGAGVERFLVPELPAHVVVTRAPVFGHWMAEYVLGWCLWLSQKKETYRAAQRERRWIQEVEPEPLGGRTMTIVGLGDIGRALARPAAALGLRVLGVSRRARRVPHVDRVYARVALVRALGAADIVVLAVPLTSRTRGMIGPGELAALKPSAWLVNVARGPVIDETALVAALSERRIAAAILDVFDEEPLPPDHPLWTLPDVVVTPHISGPSKAEEITQVFNENLRRYRRGERLKHVVDKKRGY